jgi:hypothetical protein
VVWRSVPVPTEVGLGLGHRGAAGVRLDLRF